MVSSCSLATSSLAPPIVPTLLWRWPQTAKRVHKWLDQLINSKAIVDKISTGRAFTDRIQSLCCLWVSRPCQPLRPSCYEQVRLKGTNLRWFSRKKTGPQRQSWHEIRIDMWSRDKGLEICDLDAQFCNWRVVFDFGCWCWIYNILVYIADGRRGRSKTLCPGETAWPGMRGRWDGQSLRWLPFYIFFHNVDK